MSSDPPQNPVKKKRGFASLSKEQLLVVSASGGRKAHAMGTAHRFNPDEAREAALARYRKLSKAANDGAAEAAAHDGDEAKKP
jgi:hypothetical protein